MLRERERERRERERDESDEREREIERERESISTFADLQECSCSKSFPSLCDCIAASSVSAHAAGPIVFRRWVFQSYNPHFGFPSFKGINTVVAVTPPGPRNR